MTWIDPTRPVRQYDSLGRKLSRDQIAARQQATRDEIERQRRVQPAEAPPAPPAVEGRPETRQERAARLMHRLSTPDTPPAGTIPAELYRVTAAEKSANVARRLGLIRDDDAPPEPPLSAVSKGVRAQLAAEHARMQERLFAGTPGVGKGAALDYQTIMNTPAADMGGQS